MREEYIIVILIGIIVPILFTPIMIDAVESDDYTNGVNVEFSYPKSFTNLKSDNQIPLIQDLTKTQEINHTPEMTDVIEMNYLIDESDIEPTLNSEEIELFTSEVNVTFESDTGMNTDE